MQSPALARRMTGSTGVPGQELARSVEIAGQEVGQGVRVHDLPAPTGPGLAAGVVDQRAAEDVDRLGRHQRERLDRRRRGTDRRRGRRRRESRRGLVVGQRNQARRRLLGPVGAHDAPVAVGQARRVRARAVQVVGRAARGVGPWQREERLVVLRDAHPLGAAIAAGVVGRVELRRLEQPVDAVHREVVRRHVGADQGADLHPVAVVGPQHRRIRIGRVDAELHRREVEAVGAGAQRIDLARGLHVQRRIHPR